MTLSNKTAIIIGCIVGITVLIIFGLILWYFYNKTRTFKIYCCFIVKTDVQPSYSKIDQLPADKSSNVNDIGEFQNNNCSPESKDEETDILRPLSTTTRNSSICVLSYGPSTNKILNMDSNNVFANRWDSGNELLFSEIKTEQLPLNIERKQSEIPFKYPKHRSIAPSTKPIPISDEYTSINTPNEVLLPLKDSDWAFIQKLRQKYGNRLNILYPDDMIRFVQGYAHMEDRETQTFKRMDALLKRGFSMDKYENEWDFQQILYDDMPEEAECLKVWPIFFYGYDKAGHPIMYDEIGCANPADLDKCFDGKNKYRKLRTFRFRIMRRFQNMKRMQNMRYGYDGSVNDKGGFNSISKQCIVLNMKNFYAKSLTGKYRNLVKDVVVDESNIWPNTLEHMFIINSPWAFRATWQMFSRFIDPRTVKRIHILGEGYIESMKEHIDLDQIPKLYGGTGELQIKYGYAADIDNDILDGYYLMNDPIDLESVSCKKNGKKTNFTCSH